MWNEDKSCSTGTCSTSKCGKMMMPMMIIVLVLVIAWVFVYANKDNTSTENMSMKNDAEKIVSHDNTDMNVGDEKMMDNKNEWTEEEMKKMKEDEKSSMKMEDKMDMAMESGYKIYSPELLVANKANVLFFAASWCPACQAADKNFSSETIPENINLLKVDYDKYNDLKVKYWVTMQHTYVEVDTEWNLIKKWSGSTNVSDLLKEI